MPTVYGLVGFEACVNENEERITSEDSPSPKQTIQKVFYSL